ncbi:MAG: hypothetical protein HZY76_11760 [Anaerolineae bacterium]|nr:MAG: hypothetical protein HZY76_11760 [Anaerolineae bacterium]
MTDIRLRLAATLAPQTADQTAAALAAGLAAYETARLDGLCSDGVGMRGEAARHTLARERAGEE